MINVKKYIASILLGTMLVVAVPMSALAVEVGMEESKQLTSVIQPRLNYIRDGQAGLSINNGIATVDCWVKGGITSATKAKVIAELQLKSGNSWMAYGTWTSTQNDYEAYVYETKSVKAGQTYRVKATYTVWEGSQSETIVVFSDEVTA